MPLDLQLTAKQRDRRGEQRCLHLHLGLPASTLWLRFLYPYHCPVGRGDTVPSSYEQGHANSMGTLAIILELGDRVLSDMPRSFLPGHWLFILLQFSSEFPPSPEGSLIGWWKAIGKNMDPMFLVVEQDYIKQGH